MSKSEELRQKWFGHWVHPYRTYEEMVLLHLSADSVLLDAGCGRFAPVLRNFQRFIFLVPDRYDYVSILSIILPSSLQKIIVSRLEGRQPEDVFPAYYRANSYSSISRLRQRHGFISENFLYLGQYPSMFMFHPLPFLLASAYEKLLHRIHWLRFFRGWLLVMLRKPQQS